MKKMISELQKNSNKKNNIEDEISYLCKLLHTSRPEQYIYTYIKQIFPNTVRCKKFEWLMYNAEFDIFVPELSLAIEYDGFHWHKDKLSDYDKNKLAKENSVLLFRIREIGLEETNCDCYFYNYNKIYDNIDKPINAIIDFINIKYNKTIEKIREFNFNLIKLQTLENLREQKKQQSLIGKWEEIETYWNYKDNNGLRPEDVRTTYKYCIKAICPYCSKNVKFIPRLSYYYYGKYSFTPHICKELDEYCISVIEKKCKNGKLELFMNNLDDRRIKDWLIRIVKSREFFTTLKDIKVLKQIEKKIGFEINCKNLYELNIADYNDLAKVIKRELYKK